MFLRTVYALSLLFLLASCGSQASMPTSTPAPTESPYIIPADAPRLLEGETIVLVGIGDENRDFEVVITFESYKADSGRCTLVVPHPEDQNNEEFTVKIIGPDVPIVDGVMATGTMTVKGEQELDSELVPVVYLLLDETWEVKKTDPTGKLLIRASLRLAPVGLLRMS